MMTDTKISLIGKVSCKNIVEQRKTQCFAKLLLLIYFIFYLCPVSGSHSVLMLMVRIQQETLYMGAYVT